MSDIAHLGRIEWMYAAVENASVVSLCVSDTPPPSPRANADAGRTPELWSAIVRSPFPSPPPSPVWGESTLFDLDLW